MRWFRYPLHPLTQTGRVLVCVAVSVFAALLLVAWTPARDDAAVSMSPATSAGAAQ